jgi:hypothetical protein
VEEVARTWDRATRACTRVLPWRRADPRDPPFLEGEVDKPFFLSMTAAGQSALNVQGLDTVVIDDTRFTNVVEQRRNVLTRLHLGANEILQMAGRVHGRVEGGRVFILSDRDIRFDQLRRRRPSSSWRATPSGSR